MRATTIRLFLALVVFDIPIAIAAVAAIAATSAAFTLAVKDFPDTDSDIS